MPTIHNPALQLASKYGRAKVVRLLLGAELIIDDARANNNQVLWLASMNYHVRVVGLLLGTDPTGGTINGGCPRGRVSPSRI